LKLSDWPGATPERHNEVRSGSGPLLNPTSATWNCSWARVAETKPASGTVLTLTRNPCASNWEATPAAASGKGSRSGTSRIRLSGWPPFSQRWELEERNQPAVLRIFAGEPSALALSLELAAQPMESGRGPYWGSPRPAKSCASKECRSTAAAIACLTASVLRGGDCRFMSSSTKL